MAVLTEAARALTAPEGAAPLGSRLWLYTNFDCNLACDYCSAGSSPRAAPRRLPPEGGPSRLRGVRGPGRA